MHGDIDILHHVGLIGSDMDALIQRYERLGFTFTPLSLPRIVLAPGGLPEPLGVGNRCAIFQRNYLEMLAVVDQARWDGITKAQRGPFDIDEPLSRHEGLHVMHFGADDLEAVRARLVRQQTACSEIRLFQRPVDTPDGPRMMRAKALSFPPGSDPEGLIQIAQHVTPELVLQPRYMHHPNRALGVTETIVCARDPGGLAAKYERYTGHDRARQSQVHVVDLGYSRVVVVAPQDLGSILPGCALPAPPCLAGFTVATADLAAARRVLANAHVPFHEHGERLIVPPEEACGSVVLFEQQGATRP